MSDSALDGGAASIEELLREYKMRCNLEHLAPADALPQLTEPEEQQYRQFPPQLFQHLMLDRKPLLDYEGPLVLATPMVMQHEVGGRGVACPCLFCEDEMFEDIDEHLQSRHDKRIHLMWVEEVGVSIGQFRSHLVDRAWFLHQNYLAWWLQNGTLIPCLGNTNYPVEKPTADSVFCCYCYVLVQKASWDAHCRTCSLICSLKTKPSLGQNFHMLWQILDESTRLHVIHEFTNEILEQLTGEVKKILDDDLVLSHMLLLEFGTHPYDIPALVQLCHLVCNFFVPLLSSSGEALPANLLQFRYNKLLTQRLHDYDGDKKSKATLLRILRTLVQQNYKHIYAEAEKDNKQMHLFFQAVELNANLECSREWLLPNICDEDETWSVPSSDQGRIDQATSRKSKAIPRARNEPKKKKVEIERQIYSSKGRFLKPVVKSAEWAEIVASAKASPSKLCGQGTRKAAFIKSTTR